MRAPFAMFAISLMSLTMLSAGCHERPWATVEQKQPLRRVVIDGDEAPASLLDEVKVRRDANGSPATSNSKSSGEPRLVQVEKTLLRRLPRVQDQGRQRESRLAQVEQALFQSSSAKNMLRNPKVLAPPAKSSPVDKPTPLASVKHRFHEIQVSATRTLASSDEEKPRPSKQTVNIRLKGVSSNANGQTIALLDLGTDGSMMASRGETITWNGEFGPQQMVVTQINSTSVELSDSATNARIIIR